jgi:hypothetical protein
MAKETIQKICLQLQELQTIDFTKKKQKLSPIQKELKKIKQKAFGSPDEISQKVCQYIKEDKLKNTPYFALSIKRMLQTEQLDKEGLKKIIETIKEKYQID